MMHYILPISMLLIGLAVTRTLQAVIPDWANYRCQLCCHLWGLSVSGLWGQTFYVYLWGQTLLFVFTSNGNGVRNGFGRGRKRAGHRHRCLS